MDSDPISYTNTITQLAIDYDNYVLYFLHGAQSKSPSDRNFLPGIHLQLNDWQDWHEKNDDISQDVEYCVRYPVCLVVYTSPWDSPIPCSFDWCAGKNVGCDKSNTGSDDESHKAKRANIKSFVGSKDSTIKA